MKTDILNYIRLIVILSMVMTNIPMLQAADLHGQQVGVIVPIMPKPGDMVNLSPAFTPAHLKGMTVHPDNPLQFDFLMDKGESNLNDADKKQEYTKIIKYFLSSLTIADKDQWVNLSPYESGRIIENNFGKTEMGRDLLAQDYLLKQVTSSLMYPESGLGKKFWDKVYERAFKEFGHTNVPVNTINKVWIMPDEAVVYESKNTALILKSHLKVMLEEDYLATKTNKTKSTVETRFIASQTTNRTTQDVIRQIILPELEKEINEGKNFAQLRQIVSAMVLATWYKQALKESLLGKVYADKSKIKGVDLLSSPKSSIGDPDAIYQQYLTAFKKGVYSYIKDDEDKYTQQRIPRKYFSGGFNAAMSSRLKVFRAEDLGNRFETLVDPSDPNVNTISSADVASLRKYFQERKFQSNHSVETVRANIEAENDSTNIIDTSQTQLVSALSIIDPLTLDQMQLVDDFFLTANPEEISAFTHDVEMGSYLASLIQIHSLLLIQAEELKSTGNIRTRYAISAPYISTVIPPDTELGGLIEDKGSNIELSAERVVKKILEQIAQDGKQWVDLYFEPERDKGYDPVILFNVKSKKMYPIEPRIKYAFQNNSDWVELKMRNQIGAIQTKVFDDGSKEEGGNLAKLVRSKILLMLNSTTVRINPDIEFNENAIREILNDDKYVDRIMPVLEQSLSVRGLRMRQGSFNKLINRTDDEQELIQNYIDQINQYFIKDAKINPDRYKDSNLLMGRSYNSVASAIRTERSPQEGVPSHLTDQISDEDLTSLGVSAPRNMSPIHERNRPSFLQGGMLLEDLYVWLDGKPSLLANKYTNQILNRLDQEGLVIRARERNEDYENLVRQLPVGVVSRASLLNFVSIKDTKYDPDAPESIWIKVSNGEVRLNPNKFIDKEIVNKVINNKEEFPGFWRILSKAMLEIKATPLDNVQHEAYVYKGQVKITDGFSVDDIRKALTYLYEDSYNENGVIVKVDPILIIVANELMAKLDAAMNTRSQVRDVSNRMALFSQENMEAQHDSISLLIEHYQNENKQTVTIDGKDFEKSVKVLVSLESGSIFPVFHPLAQINRRNSGWVDAIMYPNNGKLEIRLAQGVMATDSQKEKINNINTAISYRNIEGRILDWKALKERLGIVINEQRNEDAKGERERISEFVRLLISESPNGSNTGNNTDGTLDSYINRYKNAAQNMLVQYLARKDHRGIVKAWINVDSKELYFDDVAEIASKELIIQVVLLVQGGFLRLEVEKGEVNLEAKNKFIREGYAIVINSELSQLTINSVEVKEILKSATAKANRAKPVLDPMVDTNYGGIDLNSANFSLNIKRDGNGIVLPLIQQDMQMLNRIEGFVPRIIEIRPATNLPIISELKERLESAQKLASTT